MSTTNPPERIASTSLVRRLIIDFFKLGTITRCEICFLGGWLNHEDTGAHEGQALWALAFQRAMARGELDKMREMVDANTPNGMDEGLRTTANEDTAND